MTFLELVSMTRLISGMQGTGPTSTSGAVGVEEIIVRFVKDAYIDIQNLREEWDFLATKQSFSTVVGKSEYTPLDIFMTSTPNLKKYDPKSFIITDAKGKKIYLKSATRIDLERTYLNDASTKLPAYFAIEEIDRGIILKSTPDATYNVAFRYWRSPEILSADTQIPLLPVSFHLLIVYKAIEKMATYLNAPELYREYAVETAKMQGSLMRMYVPALRLKARPFV